MAADVEAEAIVLDGPADAADVVGSFSMTMTE